MLLSRIIESFISPLTHMACVECNKTGLPLCEACVSAIEYPDRCFLCKASSVRGLTCGKCVGKTPISQQVVVATHERGAKKLVYHIKYGAARSSARHAGKLLADKLPFLPEAVIVPIPTTNSRVRQRGFDQASVMAASIGRHVGYPVEYVLKRVGNDHQIGSGRKQRIEHMKHAFELKSGAGFADKTALLVDDVVTTGATMEAAARLLKKAGAKHVIACSFTRAI